MKNFEIFIIFIKRFVKTFPNVSNDTVFQRKSHHLDGGGKTQFVEDICLVTVDCTEGDMELVSNLFAK